MPNVASNLLGDKSGKRKEIVLPPLCLQQDKVFIKAKVKPTTIKIKLCRDLAVMTSSYVHAYAPFKFDSKGSAVKENLNRVGFLRKYITYGPLTLPMQKISGTEQLQAGEALPQLQMIEDWLIVGTDAPMDDIFEKASQEFGTKHWTKRYGCLSLHLLYQRKWKCSSRTKRNKSNPRKSIAAQA